MGLKLQEALRQESMNIVEYARSLRNADYSKWEKGQRLPQGMARVDIDSRPFGEYDAIFKNYDYVSDPIKGMNHPDVGFYHPDQSRMIKRNARIKNIQKIASKYGIKL